MQKIIQKYIEQGNKQQLFDGTNWYKRVNRHCNALSEKYNVDAWKVAGVISALSPRNNFKRNLQDAESVIKYGLGAKVCTFNNNKEKAVKVLSCKSYSEALQLFKGQKTNKFFKNIADLTSNDAVIDVHMIRALKIEGSLTPKKYNLAEKAIQDYANKVGLKAYQVQAIVWAVVRGESY